MQNELQHYGVKGMKWGVRRYQNSDGSLTPEGKVHYSKISKEEKQAAGRFVAGAAVGGTIGYSGGKLAGMTIKELFDIPVDSTAIGYLTGYLLAQKYSDEYSRDGKRFTKRFFRKK